MKLIKQLPGSSSYWEYHVGKGEVIFGSGEDGLRKYPIYRAPRQGEEYDGRKYIDINVEKVKKSVYEARLKMIYSNSHSGSAQTSKVYFVDVDTGAYYSMGVSEIEILIRLFTNGVIKSDGDIITLQVTPFAKGQTCFLQPYIEHQSEKELKVNPELYGLYTNLTGFKNKSFNSYMYLGTGIKDGNNVHITAYICVNTYSRDIPENFPTDIAPLYSTCLYFTKGKPTLYQDKERDCFKMETLRIKSGKYNYYGITTFPDNYFSLEKFRVSERLSGRLQNKLISQNIVLDNPLPI